MYTGKPIRALSERMMRCNLCVEKIIWGRSQSPQWVEPYVQSEWSHPINFRGESGTKTRAHGCQKCTGFLTSQLADFVTVCSEKSLEVAALFWEECGNEVEKRCRLGGG